MSEWGPFAAIILCAVLLAVSAFLVANDSKKIDLRQQAIERGYALYCPTTGDWAWKGECDQ